MINNMNIGTKVKAVKDMYYVTRDDFYDNLYTQEEIMNSVTQYIKEGDVYELKTDDWECIEGSMVGEMSDCYFEMRSMIERGVFEVLSV